MSTLFALDTWFYNSLGSYPFEAKCEILAETGFDGVNLTLWSDESWADVPRIASVRDSFGIDVTGVYTSIADERDQQGIARIQNLIETMVGCSTIDLAVLGSSTASANSDTAGDVAVLPVIERLTQAAAERGIVLSLYHHINSWMETLGDAQRLRDAIDAPNLKLTFSSHHWYLTDGRNPQPTIQAVAPHLSAANFCGSRRVASDNGTAATIELLDEGELDNYYLIGLLKKAKFEGPIGIQGFSMGGDVYSKLSRSAASFRDIEARIEAHPSWLDFRADPIPSALDERA
jgi:sugar phosphate isomerase/epimerase